MSKDGYSSNSIHNKEQRLQLQRTILHHQQGSEELAESDLRAFIARASRTEGQMPHRPLAEHVQRLILCDRSGLDCLVYAKAYADDNEELEQLRQDANWKWLKNRMKSALVILVEPSEMIPFKVNRFRTPIEDWEEWMRLHQAFVDILKEEDIRYVVLGDQAVSLEERVKFVVENWKSIRMAI